MLRTLLSSRFTGGPRFFSNDSGVLGLGTLGTWTRARVGRGCAMNVMSNQTWEISSIGSLHSGLATAHPCPRAITAVSYSDSISYGFSNIMDILVWRSRFGDCRGHSSGGSRLWRGWWGTMPGWRRRIYEGIRGRAETRVRVGMLL